VINIRETYARCHAVLYRDFEQHLPDKKFKRITKLQLFRDLKEALLFFQEKQATGDALQLFIEPPMLDGIFAGLDFGNEDDLS
jgi:hypothetical protein